MSNPIFGIPSFHHKDTVKKGEELLTYIREGREMTRQEKLNLIIQLSIPSILAQLSTIIMFFIDAAMVGHLGARQSAAIGLVESTTWLIGGLTSAASMGFSVQVAHFIGANDFKAARRVLRQSLVCCAVWSLAICLLAILIHLRLPYWLGGTQEIASDASLYFLVFACAIPFFQLEGLCGSMLKCAGNMKVPSILNICMCVMDVIFNYFFIFVADMGVMGAAMGTLLAFIVTAGLMTYFLLVRSKELSLAQDPMLFSTHGETWNRFRPTAEIVRNAVKIGAPMGLQHVLMGGAQIVSTMIVAPLGTIAIAANSFAITVESICYMPGFGLAEAATTLVGQALGAGQRLLTRSFAFMSVGMGMVVMTFMGVLMYLFAPELMGVMTPVAAIRDLGAASLRIEAFAEPMFAAAIVANGVFVGAGDTMKPAMMSLFSMWAVRLTLAYALAQQYGLKGVWTAMAIELSFRGILFLIRLFSKGWTKNLSVNSTY